MTNRPHHCSPECPSGPDNCQANPFAPSPFARTNQAAALVPWARGFKIADNQSPTPQDRLFYSFHYFDDMNGDINRRIGSPITEMQVYRQLLGIEKTFWKERFVRPPAADRHPLDQQLRPNAPT